MYLRVSVTDRCDFRCWYCRPERGASSGGSNPILAPASLLAVLAGIHRAAPLHKVRLTGGEPLLRPDLEDIVAGLRTMLPDADLAITTNGHGLAERASSHRAAGRCTDSRGKSRPATNCRMSRATAWPFCSITQW